MSHERSENRLLILIFRKSLQIALKFFWYATTCPSEKITCFLYTVIRVIENIILTICSNHHLWCLSFFWSYLSNLFVASFFLAYISVIYVWSPNQKRYFVTRNSLIMNEVILSLLGRGIKPSTWQDRNSKILIPYLTCIYNALF